VKGVGPKVLAKWVLGPLLIFVVAVTLGRLLDRQRRGQFFVATSALAESELKSLEAVPAVAVGNAAWTFGPVGVVKETLKAELDRLPETDGARRARVFLRFGIVDTNPDGQAAVFNQACSADPNVCDDRLKGAAEREARARLVAPGNRLPLYFIPGHPPVPKH
jgi:hypothetical protein